MDLKSVKVAWEESGETPDGWAEGTRNFVAFVGFTAVGKTVWEDFEYHQGPGIDHEPRKRDLLTCLASDGLAGDQTFADFCHELGLDEDSRKAHATWEACRETYVKLEQVFGTALDDFLSTDWDV